MGEVAMSNERCKECGHFRVAPGKSWIAKSNTRTFQGPNAQGLTQTSPPPVVKSARPKSLTRIRLEQTAMLSCCFVASWLSRPLPAPFDVAIVGGSAVFALSVALGKDNQEGLFRLGSSVVKFFDRNKDGSVDIDDLRDTIEDLRERLDEFLNKSATPVHEPPPDIEYTDQDGTKPIPGPEPYIARSLVIRAKTIDQPALVVELDTLCAFLRAAVGLGEWTRKFWTSNERGDYKLSPDTWQAYFHFFSRRDVGVLWKMHPPTPDLPGVIGKFRQWATDQPETDQPTEGNNA